MPGFLLDAVFVQPAVELRTRKPQFLRRLRLVPVAVVQHTHDRLALDVAQVRRHAAARLRRARQREMTGVDDASRRTGSPRVRARCEVRACCRASRSRERLARIMGQPRRRTPEDRPMLFRIASLSGRMSSRARAAARCGCRTPAGGSTGPRGSRRAPPPCAGPGWSPRSRGHWP